MDAGDYFSLLRSFDHQARFLTHFSTNVHRYRMLRLRDTKWGVVRAPNAITRSTKSHLTGPTKDEAQIERYLMRVHIQKEEVALYERSFMGGQL